MGQKVNPISQRLKIVENWRSNWFERGNFSANLISDLRVRAFLGKRLKNAAVERIEISRDANKFIVDIYTGRPGLIIGRRGTGTDELKNLLGAFSKSKVQINIIESKNPDAQASIIAQNVAASLERRVPFKRVIKQSLERVREAGAVGAKIRVAGRLGGAEIARSEKSGFGTVPLSSFKNLIDYAYAEAKTTYGIIGVKVWVYKGENAKSNLPAGGQISK